MATRTVTLALMPEQVDTLVAARAKGQLSLALRGVNDHEVVTSKRRPRRTNARWKAHEEARQKLERELAELKQALAARPVIPVVAAAPARPPARRVHIYRGGRIGRARRPRRGRRRPAGRDDRREPARRPARPRCRPGPVAAAGPIAEATALLRRAEGVGGPLP